MGLMIYDKRDGPFALRLERVEAYSQGQPAARRVATPGVRKRLLVASALIGSNKELQAQLADIRASQAAFAERDMLLVVLLDGAGSRAGDRTLTATEVAAMRKTLGITPGAFALRLVGKDGSVKRAASRPTAMKDLYALIDTMPMRRAEMGR